VREKRKELKATSESTQCRVHTMEQGSLDVQAFTHSLCMWSD